MSSDNLSTETPKPTCPTCGKQYSLIPDLEMHQFWSHGTGAEPAQPTPDLSEYWRGYQHAQIDCGCDKCLTERAEMFPEQRQRLSQPREGEQE